MAVRSTSGEDEQGCTQYSRWGRTRLYAVLQVRTNMAVRSTPGEDEQGCTQYSRWGRTRLYAVLQVRTNKALIQKSIWYPLIYMQKPVNHTQRSISCTNHISTFLRKLEIILHHNSRSRLSTTASHCLLSIKYPAFSLFTPKCITIHLSTLNSINHSFDQSHSLHRSALIFSTSSPLVTTPNKFVSSANLRILFVSPSSMSLI